MNINELKKMVKEKSQAWLEVGEYKFLYQKLGGTQFIKLGSNVNGTGANDVYVDILVNSIVDWKNVTQKDLFEEGTDFSDMTGFDPDQAVKFDRELFDAFLQNHINLVGELFQGIEKTQVATAKKLEDNKKK